MTHRSAVPATMTAADWYGTTDLIAQLRQMVEEEGWYTPAHLVVEVAARCLEALTGQPVEVQP